MINFMALELRPLYAVLVSLIASGLIYVLGEHIRPNAREAITMVAAVCKAAIVYSLIPAVLAGTEIKLEVFKIVKGVSFAFNVDPAGMVFACVASTLWILTSIYSIGYMRGHGEQNQTGYFAAFLRIFSSSGIRRSLQAPKASSSTSEVIPLS